MADQPGTLEQIAIAVGRALAKLGTELEGEGLAELLTRLGIVFPPSLLANPDVTAARDQLTFAANQLPTAIDGLIAAAETEDLPQILARGNGLRTLIAGLIEGFEDLPAALDAARVGFPEIDDAQFAQFAEGFARKLLDLLIADALDARPALGGALSMLGLLERVQPFVASNIELFDVERATLRYDRITRLLRDPVGHLSAVYDWGLPEFDGTKLLPALADLLGRLGLPAAYHGPTESTSTLLEAWVLDVVPDATLDPPGLRLRIVAPFGKAIDETFALPDPAWSGKFSASGRFATALTGSVRPPLRFGVSAATSFEGSADLQIKGERENGFVLIGSAGGNRLELKAITLDAGVTFSSADGARAEPAIRAAITGGRVLIDGGSGDGFVSSVLGNVKVDSSFDINAGWSPSDGLRFEGSSALTIMLPVHAELGPFAVHELFLIGSLDDERVVLELSSSLSAKLGPLAAVITRIGFKSALSFPGEGGNAGPVQVDFAFKPPSGVGLSLDLRGVRGGGFLEVDPDRGRYVGMMQLQFQRKIDITAVGIIDTRLPDGSDGFSLLIIISARFQPIQLGMGFTLNGVGGLLGLNRTLNVEGLRQTLASGAMSSVLFPEDPIANASQIISDVTGIFPASRGHFVIGPMVRIGYGSPTFITLDAGLVLEVPDPVRVALLGVLQALLPDADAPLIELRINFLGTMDFQTGEIAFDATLYDSRLLAFNLSGDLSVRMRWFGLKMVLLTVGGFHPSFQPPPLGLPTLRRLTVQLLDGNNPRIRLELYLAVTSNTYQLGARVELTASAGPFGVYGFLSFDVLLQLWPLHFDADVKAMLALRSGSSTIASISLALSLFGPAPWHAKGTASLKLFWFLTIKLRFERTWGEERDAILAALAVLPLLLGALARRTNWRPELPPERNLLVSVREPAPGPGSDAIVLHPIGGLSITQQVVPLRVAIDKFGERKPSDHQTFAISDVRVNGHTLDPTEAAAFLDDFAPAQFFARSDAEKLSAESYVRLDAGVTFGSSELVSSRYARRAVDYELKYRDSQRATASPRAGFSPDAAAFSAWAKNGATARSSLSFATASVSAIAPPAVAVGQERFAVAHVSDLTLAGANAEAASETEALLLMRRLIAARPELTGRLQVVPSFELNREHTP